MDYASPLRGPVGSIWPKFGDIVRETRTMLVEIVQSPALIRAAVLILPYAGVLVGLDVAGHYGTLTSADLPVQFNLASDGGFGEWLEYSLTAAIAVMLLLLWRRQGDWIYMTNAALFVWLTLDNSLEFHEQAGMALAPYLAPINFLPVEPNHLGEPILFLAIGLMWIAGLWTSLKAARLRPALYALLLAGCICGAAFFGVIVDLMVVWGQHSPTDLEVETFIEDGGEFAMICLSFLLTVAIFDIERKKARKP